MKKYMLKLKFRLYFSTHLLLQKMKEKFKDRLLNNTVVFPTDNLFLGLYGYRSLTFT